MNKVPKFPMSIWGKLQSKKYKRKSENRFEFLELSFDWNCLDTPLCGPLSVVIKDFCFPQGLRTPDESFFSKMSKIFGPFWTVVRYLGYYIGFDYQHKFCHCALWHFRLWNFKTRDTKLERFLHKNQLTQRKFLNFENMTNGEPQ